MGLDLNIQHWTNGTAAPSADAIGTLTNLLRLHSVGWGCVQSPHDVLRGKERCRQTRSTAWTYRVPTGNTAAFTAELHEEVQHARQYEQGFRAIYSNSFGLACRLMTTTRTDDYPVQILTIVHRYYCHARLEESTTRGNGERIYRAGSHHRSTLHS